MIANQLDGTYPKPSPAEMSAPPAPSGPVPDLSFYDELAPQLSGGKDSALMLWLLMGAARSAGLVHRVRTYHASLGLLDWPTVSFDGRRWLGAAELAAAQSAFFGVPEGLHVEATRTKRGADGQRTPHWLLTEMAAYGRFPRGGSRYCTKSAKDSVISAVWTPTVTDRSRELGRPYRILKIMGMRRDESRSRSLLPVFRTVVDNRARRVDEWLPALEWSTPAVKEWCESYPIARHWTYDSYPGAGDWAGTSRCSCSFCVFASRRDLLLSVGRRPRLAALYAEVEAVRGDTFTPRLRLHDLIHQVERGDAPDPGLVCADDSPAFDALVRQVRAALVLPPRKPVDRSRDAALSCTQCDGCM